MCPACHHCLYIEFPHFAAFSVFFLERDTGFESSLVICHFLSSQVAALRRTAAA